MLIASEDFAWGRPDGARPRLEVLGVLPSTPPWLAIVLAVIAVAGVMFGPALTERVKRGPKPPPDQQKAADRADTALTIVQDAMDDLQRRLNERDREVADLRRRLDERRRDDAS